MSYDLYYYFILKKKNKYYDNGEGLYPFETLVTLNKSDYKICLITEKHEIVMIRVTKKALSNERIPLEIHKEITLLKEHFLTTINLHFDPDARIRFNIHLFTKSDEKPDLNIELNEVKNKGLKLNSNKFYDFFSQTVDYRNELKLIADSQKKYIPIQFRFLSLYKFLELEFKVNGKWVTDFTRFTKTVEIEFENTKISKKKFINYLHEIRDKCAHIKSNKDILGVTSLSFEDENEIETITKFLFLICIEYINQVKINKGGAKITLRRHNNIDLA